MQSLPCPLCCGKWFSPFIMRVPGIKLIDLAACTSTHRTILLSPKCNQLFTVLVNGEEQGCE